MAEKKYSIEELETVYLPSHYKNLKNKKIGYMLKGDVWHWINGYTAEKILPGLAICKRYDGTDFLWFEYDACQIYHAFKYQYTGTNGQLFSKACHQMKEGDNLEHFLCILKNIKAEKHITDLPDDIDRVVTKINRPLIERSTDNPQKNIFDFITVECDLSTDFKCYRNSYIRKHISEIRQKILDKLERDENYKSYGVPVSYLKGSIEISGNTLTCKLKLKDVKQKGDCL